MTSMNWLEFWKNHPGKEHKVILNQRT